MMKYLKRLNECGSLSLTTMFSTASGALFILLFYNLSSYVGSRGAITETARAAARCITPTDPECVTVLPSNPDGIELDWYGRSLDRSITADVGVRTFKYQASMPSELWGASFDYYRVNIGDQRFSIDTALVPVKNFYAKGAYEIPSGVVNATFQVQGSTEFSPKFNPNFPLFEQDRNLRVDEWQRLQSPLPFITHESGEIAINPNDDFAYLSPAISVPKIASEDGAICIGNCNTHDLAGGDQVSWKDYAYVAVKAFSRVKAESNSTILSWGSKNNSSKNNFPGLEIEIKDENGQTINWKPEGTNLSLSWRCLGGSEQSGSVGTKWKGYNLWLRGPRGSNGGKENSASCPGGVYQHHAILVPRGGSYRVRARLANIGNNRARAKITVLSYYDEYVNSTPTNRLVECTPKTYTGYKEESSSCTLQNCVPTNCKTSYCPEKNLKSLSDNGLIKATLLSCAANRQSVSFSCAENARTIPNSAKTIQTATLAACSNDWRPQTPIASSINQETICSWETDHNVTRWQEVAASNCGLAKAASYSNTCENPINAESKPSLTNCENLKNKLDAISQATLDLNSAQILGAAKFQSLPSYRFEQLENLRLANFWTNKDLQGQLINAERITESVSGIRTFINKNNTSRTPKALDFLESIKNLGISAYGWEDFEKQANNLIKPKKLARKDYQFSNVYPFNEKVTEEIYYGQTDTTAGWDFEADCKIDTSCDCKKDEANCNFKKHQNLEQVLREYAAKEIPEAADANYALTTSATHVGFKELGKFTPGNLPELPTCYPTRAVCSEQKSKDDDVTYLGRSSVKPTECNNYNECFSRIPEGLDLNVSQSEEKIDLELAKAAGMKELKKIVPYAKLAEECGEEPGCAEIDIDTSSGSRAVVQVRYNVPVGFPLSAMLQQDSFQIIHEKQEVIERSFAGSNFYK